MLAELLVAAGERPYMLSHGSGRDLVMLVLLKADGLPADWPQHAVGPRQFVVLPLDKGATIGQVPGTLYVDGSWTASLALSKYRPRQPKE